MGATENKDLMQRIYAEFAKGNPELFLTSIAEGFRWTIMGTTKFSGTY